MHLPKFVKLREVHQVSNLRKCINYTWFVVSRSSETSLPLTTVRTSCNSSMYVGALIVKYSLHRSKFWGIDFHSHEAIWKRAGVLLQCRGSQAGTSSGTRINAWASFAPRGKNLSILKTLEHLMLKFTSSRCEGKCLYIHIYVYLYVDIYRCI